MLIRSLESREIDEELIPILKKFFSLPITPIESCYGHPQQSKDPYLCYVEDQTENDQEIKFQNLLKENITKLETDIREKIGDKVLHLTLTETDHGAGPKDYTLRFVIDDTKNFRLIRKVI